MNIPILCMTCGRKASIDPFRATASPRCVCGSSDFDVDDMGDLTGDGGGGWPGAYEEGYTDGYGWGRRGEPAQSQAPDAPTSYVRGYNDGYGDSMAGRKPKLMTDELEAILGARKTATEALTTHSGPYSESWQGQHWSIIQEQREGMCLWRVETGGRPIEGGNYDVGLREAVEQVRAVLDAKGLPGDPEQILPSQATSAKREGWGVNSRGEQVLRRGDRAVIIDANFDGSWYMEMVTFGGNTDKPIHHAQVDINHSPKSETEAKAFAESWMEDPAVFNRVHRVNEMAIGGNSWPRSWDDAELASRSKIAHRQTAAFRGIEVGSRVRTRSGEEGVVKSIAPAGNYRGYWVELDSGEIKVMIAQGLTVVAAPSASEGLGQPVTGDCPRCGSGTYRGDLGYCPQCQLGGPGDPSAKKDSFASLQGTGRKTASVPASPIEGNRMLPIVRWETPDGTEYVDIYNNADHGDYAWQAGWTKDNYDPYAETHGGSMPHHIVSFPEFLQAMARRVKFDKLVLKFNRTGYDVEGIINGPLLPRLVPIEGSRTASVEAETKRIAKIDEITLGITTSNPGISPSRARALAIKTVDRYPGVLG